MAMKAFNPNVHMTEAFDLDDKQWERIKADLSESELVNIDNGGFARLGPLTVWNERRRAEVKARLAE